MTKRVVTGALAGAVGVVAMDLVWWMRSRRSGSGDSFFEWEFATGTSTFEEASAPGQFGQKVAGVIGVELPDEAAGVTTNVVHWATGMGYGVLHALFPTRRSAVGGGLASGAGAFATSYAVLGTIGLYEPIWEYDRETLWQDFSAHLMYGLATGLTYSAITSRRTRGQPTD